jgi:hypothetical protein
MQERLFSRELTFGHFEKAKAIMNHFFEKEIFNEVYNPQMLKFRLFSFINRIFDIIISMDLPEKELFFEELQPYERIQLCTSISEWQKSINSIIDDIEKYYNEHKDAELVLFYNRITSLLRKIIMTPI